MTDRKIDMISLNFMTLEMEGEIRHPAQIMKDLGISYRYAVPQSLYDSWQFLGCEGVPDDLPEFCKTRDVRDFRALVGYGISDEMADALEACRK